MYFIVHDQDHSPAGGRTRLILRRWLKKNKSEIAILSAGSCSKAFFSTHPGDEDVVIPALVLPVPAHGEGRGGGEPEAVQLVGGRVGDLAHALLLAEADAEEGGRGAEKKYQLF